MTLPLPAPRLHEEAGFSYAVICSAGSSAADGKSNDLHRELEPLLSSNPATLERSGSLQFAKHSYHFGFKYYEVNVNGPVNLSTKEYLQRFGSARYDEGRKEGKRLEWVEGLGAR